MASEFSSRISGFYKKPVDERISIVAERVGLSEEEVATLKSNGGLVLMWLNNTSGKYVIIDISVYADGVIG